MYDLYPICSKQYYSEIAYSTMYVLTLGPEKGYESRFTISTYLDTFFYLVGMVACYIQKANKLNKVIIGALSSIGMHSDMSLVKLDFLFTTYN